MTLGLWSVSTYCSSRSARILGSSRANILRLGLSCLVLTLIVAVAGYQLWCPGVSWHVLAGVAHLGMGDALLLSAYRHIGPRLAVLVCLCVAVPLALLFEWLALGQVPPLSAMLCALAIVVAVAMAVAPRDRHRLGRRAVTIGVVLALVAAACQAGGAVSTRYAEMLDQQGGVALAPLAKAGMRVAGGVLVALVLWALRARVRVGPGAYDHASTKALAQHQRLLWPWVLASGLIGPVFGVGALQAALATTPAAVVQAVICLLPVTMVPIAWACDGDRPTLRFFVGAALAVVATAALAMVV
ncbi:MAG: EamA family transporter [Planctomycetota bacterium]